MIYKKIGSKIPSFSSLLLAGFFSTANGCGCGNSSTQIPLAPPNGLINTDINDGVIPIVDLGSAQARCMNYLIVNVLGLDCLKQYSTPLPLSEMAIKDKDHRIAGRLIETFQKKAESYPARLKASLAPLADIDLKDSKIKDRSRAFVRLLNEIASYWERLNSLYFDLKSSNGSSEVLQTLKKEKFSLLFDDLDINKETCTLRPSFSHLDQATASFLTGPKLARFLSDTDSEGAKRTSQRGSLTSGYSVMHPYGVDETLNKKQTCLLKSKLVSTSYVENTRISSPNLQQRGSALGQPVADPLNLTKQVSEANLLKVGSGSDTGYIPYIAKIENNTVTRVFDPSKMKEYFDELGDTISFDATKAQATIIKSAASSLPDSHSVVSRQLTFGTILFTLFRGNTDFDFLSLTKNGDQIQLSGSNHNYAKWINKENFADLLSRHIQNTPELADIFYIPNLEEIEAILSPFKILAGSLPMNGPSTSTQPLTLGSPLETLCEVVFAGVGLPEVVYKGNNGDYLKFIQKIATLREDTVLEKSDISFQGMLFVKLAHKIVSLLPDLVPSTPQGSSSVSSSKTVADFIAIIKSLIDEEKKYAILVRNDQGVIELTDTSRTVRSWIEKLNVQLGEKAKRKEMFFSDIPSIRRRDNAQSAQFDIEEVNEAFKDILIDMEPLFDQKFESFLNNPESVSEEHFPGMSLAQNHLKDLDQIRQTYQKIVQNTQVRSTNQLLSSGEPAKDTEK